MWTSQDIWVRNLNDAGTVHQNPEFGQTNYIHVKIRNRGMTTVQNAPVKVYVADASTGLSWPVDWTYVGQDYVVSLAPGGTTTIVVPWNPAGTGHYCIIARIDTAQDPMTNLETTSIDFNVRYNNNICWKNVNVVNLVLSAGGHGFELVKFIFRHVARDQRPVRLMVREPGVTSNQAPFLARGEITLVLDDRLADIWRRNGGVAEGVEQVDGRTFVMRHPQKASLDFVLEAGDEFKVALEFRDRQPTIGNGQALVYTVQAVQQDLETGEEVGGVAYEILAPPPL
jgi:extracellular elastinolytic metalloproteinase